MDRPALPAHPLHVLARPSASVLASCVLLLAPAAWAQAGRGAPALRASPLLQEQWSDAVRAQLPVFVRGERVEGQPDIQATVEGNAELRRGDTVIHADRLEYDAPEDRAKASGQVRINRAGNLYEGTLLDLKVNAFEGFFTDVRYRLLANGAHGDSTRVEFIDRDRTLIHEGNYTTCERQDSASWRPDWVLRARSLHLDKLEDVGVAKGGVLEFKGVPILPIPSISFPLSNRRKSGLLPPTIGLDSVSGFEYAQPWYWNIAPNRDATITPTLMTRRGVGLGGEFRYLEPRYSGELSANVMPGDRLRERDRWALGVQHRASLDSPLGGLNLNLNARRVSDNDYWRDFPQRTNSAGLVDHSAQRLLPGDASLSWASGAHSMSLRTLKWQTLQDPLAPITPPYDLLPQLHWNYQPGQLPAGLDASVQAQYTHFQVDRLYYAQPNSQRSVALAQISRPFLAPGGFFTPRLQLHATQYRFDQPLAGGAERASRVLPTLSLDSGLVFEREARYFGSDYVQTLEPRAFYTRTPYKDQSRLPVYDSAQQDFNFASIYTENAYVGNDRIADNNLLTLGLTTRLLGAGSGAEAVRLALAQRLRFSDQRVTLPGQLPTSERVSDLLLGAGINWTPEWSLDALTQYNPKTRRSERTTVAARYSPAKYHTLSAAYRMARVSGLITEPSEQIDVGWQWPINDLWGDRRSRPTPDAGRWYGVGRVNYSLRDRKVVDTIVGLEYESCCWIGRVVFERLQRGLNESTTRILLQLELSGFSRLSLGSNPLASLKQNVPRYQMLGEGEQTAPSRFSRYD